MIRSEGAKINIFELNCNLTLNNLFGKENSFLNNHSNEANEVGFLLILCNQCTLKTKKMHIALVHRPFRH